MTNERVSTPAQLRSAQNPSARGAPRKGGINWFRFWMQMLVAVLVFNVIAGLVTWLYIFPKLHPNM